MDDITISLIDDHKMIRDGLKTYLEDYPHIKVLVEASDGKEALELLEKQQVDVVITDIAMPEMDGLEFVKAYKSKHPEQKTLALTMLNENQYIKQMIAAGANGYILKTCTEKEFITAIEQVNAGNSYYAPEVTEVIMNSLTRKKKPSKRLVYEIPLTDRETEVLHLICHEKSNAEIADQLFISVRTVESHKRNLLEKTGCKNVAGLVVYALEKELFSDL